MTSSRASVIVVCAMLVAPACAPEGTPPQCDQRDLPDDCTNPEVRASLGDQSSGRKTLRVRARIAKSAAGAPAVEASRPLYDVITLNVAFASSNIRFLLEDVEELPADAALYDLDTDSNPLCEGELKDLSLDAIPILYVSSLAVEDRSAGGAGNRCGAIVRNSGSQTFLYGVHGSFTDPQTLVHEVGHVLGLQHTHECIESLACSDDPEQSGDRIADTPFDPGPVGPLECNDEPIEGQCAMVDPGYCVVDCADGSTPDVRNFMSYYRGCGDRFSAGQSVYMRCEIEKTHAPAQCNNLWAQGFGEDWALSGSSGGEASWHIADVNGDGKADAVLHYGNWKDGAWHVALSNGSSFDPGKVWIASHGAEATETMVGDVDGDGKADAVVFKDGAWSVALSTGAAFATPSVWIEQHPVNAPQWFADTLLADVDGDGRADAVYFDSFAGSWSVALSTGGSFAPPVVWSQDFGKDSQEQILADVDGDGKADAAIFSVIDDPNSQFDDPIYYWQVARSTGSGFSPPETWYEAVIARPGRVMLADVDGDKKADRIHYYYELAGWFVAPSTGAAFSNSAMWIGGLGYGVLPSGADVADANVGDVNGDGKADPVAFDRIFNLWTTNVCQ